MEYWARGQQFGGKVDFLCISVVGKRTAEQFQTSLRLDTCTLAFIDGAMPRFGQLGCGGFIVLDSDGTIVTPRSSSFLDLGEQAFRDVEALLGTLCESEFMWPAVLAQKSVRELRLLVRDRRIDVGACLEKKDFVNAIVMDSLAKLSSSQLKKLLANEGIDTRDCLERQDYINKVFAHKSGSTTSSGVSTADMPSFESSLLCPDGTCNKPPVNEPPCSKPLPTNEPPCKKPCVNNDDETCCSSKAQSLFQASSVPSVGNPIMDDEHTDCINAVNQLAASQAVCDLKRVLCVFDEHFRHEEELMTAKGFGGDLTDSFSAKASHQRDHSNILQKIQKIYDRTNIDPEKEVSVEDVQNIAGLFERHARNFDALYEGHL